jgi:hypothetical protein
VPGRAGLPADDVTAADARSLRACLPEIMDAVSRLLQRVRAGELAVPPGDGPPVPPGGVQPAGVRAGWL